MEVATIGFTQSSAERFFDRLRAAGVRRIVDVRRHNVSQLAGFAKGGDLAYFARAILDADYVHELRLAPTEEMLFVGPGADTSGTQRTWIVRGAGRP